MAKKTRKKTKSASTPKRTGSLDNISTDDLAKEMRRRERQVNRLLGRREKLLSQVEELDRQIASFGGPASYGGFGLTSAGKPRRRPKNDMSLSDALISVLKNKTMSVTEASEAVQRAGYQTTSSSFRTIVNQALIKDPRFKKVSRGKYTVK